MATKAFRVEGEFKMGMSKTKFSLETTAADDASARERVLSTLGSKHRADRHNIRIDSVKEISGDEITDAAVEFQLSQGA